MDKGEKDLQKCLRLGTWVILAALIFRLAGGGYFRGIGNFLRQPDVMAFILYLETGRMFRTEPVFLAEPAQTIPQTEPSPILPVFTREEGENLAIRYNCEYRPDLGALLTEPLSWDLTGEEPTVLILHTHTTESYTKTAEETYTESGSYRTLDENANMLSIGAYLAQLLEEGGVGVIQDRTVHDYPSYNGSYAAARETVEEYLTRYPTIRLVLDLHRDAAEDASGNQIGSTVTVEGTEAAQLMLVMGSDAGGLSYPNWQENLALGLKLQAQLERMAPGICRSMNFCGQRYNQDLCDGALLIEVGAAGNTRQQALKAVEMLAKSILILARGSG